MSVQFQDATGEDEGSLFETAADFFSLLALAAIYAVITFGAAAGERSAVDVQGGQAAGVAASVEPGIFYIAFETAGDSLRVTIIQPTAAGLKQRLYDPRRVDPARAIEEIRNDMAQAGNIKRVRCKLDRQEDRPEALTMFLLLLRSLQADGFVVEAGV
jgi:hypothetical protein